MILCCHPDGTAEGLDLEHGRPPAGRRYRHAATDAGGDPAGLLAEVEAGGDPLPWISKTARETAAGQVEALALPKRTRAALRRWIARAAYRDPGGPEVRLVVLVGGRVHVNGRPAWGRFAPGEAVEGLSEFREALAGGREALPFASREVRDLWADAAAAEGEAAAVQAAIRQGAYFAER